MSPQGDFANYLRVNYEQNSSFIFKYEPKDSAKSQLEFDLYAVANPNLDNKKVLFEVALPKEQEHWTVKGNLTLQGTSINF